LVGSIFGERGFKFAKIKGWHLLGPNKRQKGVKFGEFKKKKILMNWQSKYTDIRHTASLGHGL